MVSLDQHLLSFMIRWIHVISMAFLLGGALLLFALVLDSRKSEHADWLAAVASKYEWVFWLAMGIQVITGIGNVGSFGTGLPPSTSAWGAKLLLKLVLVTFFIVMSLVRTLITARLEFCSPSIVPGRVSSALRGTYGVTALFLVSIVLMAEALAHG